MQKKFDLPTPIKSAEFAVREDHTLAVKMRVGRGSRTLVFHDSIRKDGKRYLLFNPKTEINQRGNTVIVRTATTEAESGAPIPGLLVTYRFTFDEKLAAFYLSADFGSDIRHSDCSINLMDISWENMKVTDFTGYEYDALGQPFAQTFTVPKEKNTDAVDYETLKTIRLHAALERTKTRPHTFKKALALHARNAYIAVIGGTPTYQIEAGFVQTFYEMSTKMMADIRFFSGKNSPGAWFLLEQPEDFFATADALEARQPETEEHIMVPFVENRVPLHAGDFQCQLLQTKSGVWITPLYADKDISAQPYPLFFVDLWDTKYEREVPVDAGYSWEHVEILERKNYIRITLSEPENGRVRDISVIAEAFLEPKENRIRWKMKVVNRSDRWSLTNISYPQCLAQGYETAFICGYSGMLIRDFNKRCYAVRGPYPHGNRVNMPYVAMYNPVPMDKRYGNNGIYVGVHDADGTPKSVNMVGSCGSDCTLMFSESTPTYARHAGNSYTLPGEMIWQCFSGDWFDATEIYRSFVFTKAKWLAPLRGRTDSPDWIREMPVWIMHFMPGENPDANPVPITLREQNPDTDPSDWYRTAVRFREEIGVPVAYHLYNWHWVPFNNDNPNYFPTHHDMKAGMKALKEADIRVLPYMAGYSWDMCDNRGDDYRFEKEALPNTAKNLDGEVIFTTYASTEPNGKQVRFARMCPTTAMWKNEVRQICRRLYTDFGVDGIYLDVVSLQYTQCCDENHLHAPGLSDFWWKAYAELIAGIRTEAPQDFGIISECTSEVYTGALDAQLSWIWVQIDSVPAFPRVYGGRGAICGRVITNNKRNDADYFRFQIAQSLVYGQQLGWIHPEIVNDPVQFPFLKKLANIRWQYRTFFAEAEMLRPPVLEGQLPLLDCPAYLRGQIWNHEKLIQSGAWEDSEGKRSLFVINASDKAAEITLCVYEDEYHLPETIEQFDTQDGFTLLGMTSENGIRKLHCRLAGEGVGILNWN